MILTFIIISLFGVFYNSIGKDLGSVKLIKWKLRLNNKLRHYFIDGVRKRSDKAQKFTMCLFAIFGGTGFVFYVFWYYLFDSVPFNRVMLTEISFYFLTLLFGFRSDKEFKKESIFVLKSISRQISIVGLILIVVVGSIYYLKSSSYGIIMEFTVIVLVGILLIILLLYILFKLFPYLFTKSLGEIMRFVFWQIVKLDKNDSVSGLLRYFGYLSTITSIVQVIVYVYSVSS